MSTKNKQPDYAAAFLAAARGDRPAPRVRKDELDALTAAVVAANPLQVEDPDERAKAHAVEVRALIRRGDLAVVEPRVFEDARGAEYLAYREAPHG